MYIRLTCTHHNRYDFLAPNVLKMHGKMLLCEMRDMTSTLPADSVRGVVVSKHGLTQLVTTRLIILSEAAAHSDSR